MREVGNSGQNMLPWPLEVGLGAADCLGNGVWGHVGVGAAEGMLDREGMTSGVFRGPGHYTLS